MRLIDADRLETTWNQDKTMIDNVEAQPTIDPIRSAHWIENNIKMATGLYTRSYQCSRCGEYIKYVTPYCPYCASKMDDEVM